MELHRPVGETPIALAHSLAGSSATVGFTDLSHLARSLEHALARIAGRSATAPTRKARLFVDAAEEIRRLLHQFAAGFLKEPDAGAAGAPGRARGQLGAPPRGGDRRVRARRRPDSESPTEPALAVEPLLTLDGIGDADAATDDATDAAWPTRPADRRARRGRCEAGAAPRAVDADRAARADRRRRARRQPADAAGADRPQRGRRRRAAPSSPTSREPRRRPSAASALQPLGIAELKPLAAAPVEARARSAGARRRRSATSTTTSMRSTRSTSSCSRSSRKKPQELLPKLDGQLRDWARAAGRRRRTPRRACARCTR